ncbi:MFS transporter [Georgenia subflava]|uniref:MFS transporter n=1 Tax=Georgenia subflava TaxID=1622177 RepID=A0A6N7EFH4_9MICO|nr:MFS transporter [Georgenia subflava]MPV35698.1 MFS transporter [Georgenia subflava]
MDTSSLSTGPRPAVDVGAGVPWRSLLVLAAVTFVVVSGEMLPTAVLPFMAADLGVPVPQVGLLVSLWAVVVVLASFPLVRLMAGRDRRRTVAAALVVFGGASLGTALAPTFAAALGTRLVAAAACGLLWATVNAHTAAIVPEHRLGRAVAVVLGGGTLGTVLAVPAANAVAQLWDWRAAFVVLAALSAAGTLAVALLVVPGTLEGGETPGNPAARAGAEPGAARAVVHLAAAGGMLAAGHLAAFTFVTAVLARSAVDLGVLLLVFGVTSGLAVVVVGRVADLGPRRVFLVDAALLAGALLALAAVGTSAGADVAIVAIWGLVSGAAMPLAQTVIMRAAGPALRTVAGTTIPVVFNLGVALGAAAGSGAVDRLGVQSLPWLAGALALLATAVAAGTVRRRRPSRRRRSSTWHGGVPDFPRCSPKARAVAQGPRRAAVRAMCGRRRRRLDRQRVPCWQRASSDQRGR